MAEWLFESPGHLGDFRDAAKWHAVMRGEAEDIVRILVAAVVGKRPDKVTAAEIEEHRDALAYVDPTKTAPPAAAATVPIAPWPGFPRAVRRRAPWTEYPSVPGDEDGSYRAVEHLGDEDHAEGSFVDRHGDELNLPVRDRQDEYLEWAARRDADGNIVRLTFVAEGYDYFSALFKADEQRVVELYKEFTGLPSLRPDDLRARDGIYRRTAEGDAAVVEPGGFNPRNRFNIDPGIVHLSHRANSLGAEVNLAGVSGIARRNAGGDTLGGGDPERLLCCNAGGNPNRNSDPLISAQAYAQVLGKYRYTLANPVGLYVAGIEDAGLLLPDNHTSVPREWWKVVRGQDLWSAGDSRVLRLELAVPESEKLTITDLLIGGDKVRHPGQVAELLSVHLFVTRWERNDDSIGPIVACARTCCRRQGGEQLRLSNGSCGPGYDLAFPDLLPAVPARHAPTHSFAGARPGRKTR